VLAVTGSIAAFKAATVARLLSKEGARVTVVLSHAAQRFVGEATFAGITQQSVLSCMFDPRHPGEPHVELGSRSNLILIAPATADVLSRLAAGRADDLVTATALCARCPVLLAPAMHPAMWEHPATQRNVARLRDYGGYDWAGPVRGEVATGEIGVGRMAEPEEIVAAVLRQLGPRDLTGRHIVVTAGPTAEDLDPVRFISNRSSGKMGFALAERAVLRGARVTLISGPVMLPSPAGTQRVDVRTAAAMREALWQALGPELSDADALIMAAAVADYRPSEQRWEKLQRTATSLTLQLVKNPDLLAEVGGARQGRLPVLVGFALETVSADQLVSRAREKLAQKGIDLVVANRATEALDQDDNRATFVQSDRAEALGVLPKPDLADQILDWVRQRLTEVS
jgi:phosphopantothenoylcysteine decarboxylase/phosphopantothenate--cysteine ligase